jgi:hypothetical protein
MPRFAFAALVSTLISSFGGARFAFAAIATPGGARLAFTPRLAAAA